MADLYQGLVQITVNPESEDAKLVTLLAYAVFAESMDQATAKVVADWEQHWRFLEQPNGISFALTRVVKNGTTTQLGGDDGFRYQEPEGDLDNPLIIR
jgi:hypothetical protein